MTCIDDVRYWVALNRVPGLGPVRFRRLEAHFRELVNVWNAGLAELRAAGIEDRRARDIIAARDRVDPTAEMDRLSKDDVKALDWNHPQYPRRLNEIHDAPPLLYLKGDIQPGDERALAVVGTKGPKAYGREVASSLTTGLAQSGFCTISGPGPGDRRYRPQSRHGGGRQDHSRGGQWLGHGLP
jgi:DNA processing protein